LTTFTYIVLLSFRNHVQLSELSDLSLQLQDRGLSLSTANSCIKRTIHIFDSMSNTYGPKTKEVLNAGDLLKFMD